MTGTEPNEEPIALDEASHVSAVPDAPRRAYKAPKLRHLGSVRELTLGGTAGMSEGGGTFRTM